MPMARDDGRVTGRSGPSKVGVSGAMRARDVSRPRQEHLDAADAVVDEVLEEVRAALAARRSARSRRADGSGGGAARHR